MAHPTPQLVPGAAPDGGTPDGPAHGQGQQPAAPPPKPAQPSPGTPAAPREPVRTARSGFADLIADEQAAVATGTADACAHQCDCHSPNDACIRNQHADDAPHVTRLADGTLLQWAGPCPPVPDPDAKAGHAAMLEAAQQTQAAQQQNLVGAVIAELGARYKATGTLPWD